MLRFHTQDMSFESEPGEFMAYVGPNSEELLEEKFSLLP